MKIFSLPLLQIYLPKNNKKRQTHRYDHISLLRFRPGEVLQELVARRRRKCTSFSEKLCTPDPKNK